MPRANVSNTEKWGHAEHLKSQLGCHIVQPRLIKCAERAASNNCQRRRHQANDQMWDGQAEPVVPYCRQSQFHRRCVRRAPSVAISIQRYVVFEGNVAIAQIADVMPNLVVQYGGGGGGRAVEHCSIGPAIRPRCSANARPPTPCTIKTRAHTRYA